MAVRKPLHRSCASATLSVPGWPKRKSWLREGGSARPTGLALYAGALQQDARYSSSCCQKALCGLTVKLADHDGTIVHRQLCLTSGTIRRPERRRQKTTES